MPDDIRTIAMNGQAFARICLGSDSITSPPVCQGDRFPYSQTHMPCPSSPDLRAERERLGLYTEMYQPALQWQHIQIGLKKFSALLTRSPMVSCGAFGVS